MNAIERCSFEFFFAFCLCGLADTLFQQMEGSLQGDWRAAYVSPFYWAVVVESCPDKLEGTKEIYL